jgi:hypothetical protein
VHKATEIGMILLILKAKNDFYCFEKSVAVRNCKKVPTKKLAWEIENVQIGPK